MYPMYSHNFVAWSGGVNSTCNSKQWQCNIPALLHSMQKIHAAQCNRQQTITVYKSSGNCDEIFAVSSMFHWFVTRLLIINDFWLAKWRHITTSLMSTWRQLYDNQIAVCNVRTDPYKLSVRLRNYIALKLSVTPSKQICQQSRHLIPLRQQCILHMQCHGWCCCDHIMWLFVKCGTAGMMGKMKTYPYPVLATSFNVEYMLEWW